MTKYPDEAGRALAGQVTKELETYLVERRIERAEALLFVNRHLVYDALVAFSQGGAAPELLEALQEMWDTSCTNATSTPSRAAFLKAHAALAKACGK